MDSREAAGNFVGTLIGTGICTVQGAMHPPLPYTDAVEDVPPDEADDMGRLVETLQMLLRFHQQWSGEPQREVHVKSHGTARGEFCVEPDLPDGLSEGLFAEPRTYPAVVRFSNAAPWQQPDIVPDGRGLAIQLTEIEGEVLGRPGLQDFVMANSPTFFARNVKEYLELQQERLRAGNNRLRHGSRLLRYLGTPARWPGLAAALRIVTQLPSHPAAYTYYSMVPIRFGRFVAKYRVLPVAGHRGSLVDTAASFVQDPNAMRNLLADSLSRSELQFRFQAQLRISESSMPVEDATVEWPERESPYRTVATLRIPPQLLPSGPGDATEERRSFDVWNALPSHRPLGGINRARRRAYPTSARFRSADVSRPALSNSLELETPPLPASE